MHTQKPGRRRFTVRAALAVAALGLTAALAVALVVVLATASLSPLSSDGTRPVIAQAADAGTDAPRVLAGGAVRDQTGLPTRVPPSTNDSSSGRRVVAPCARTADACVQLSTAHIWLTRDGQVLRDGFISSGGDGEETPTGTFTVQWKDRDHVSGESGVPMPYSVFFTTRGHALHQGSLGTESAGCVRLTRGDAAAFFNALQPGDQLQVLP